MSNKQSGFHIIGLLIALVVVAVIVMAGIYVHTRSNGGSHSNGKLSSKDTKSLPDISYFESHKSDQFIVDMSVVKSGFPFKGKSAALPHQGMHVQFFGGDPVDWPKGGTAPENYPPVYSPVDGIVLRVDKVFSDHSKGAADLYNVDIAFAKSDSQAWSIHFSFEPFIKEPSPGFYANFIKVTQGQHVKKGDTIAYMYIPNASADGVHIHVHLNKSGDPNLYAPAIFETSIVQSFQEHWGDFGVDEIHNDPRGPKIPACMGYKLAADENPFGTGATDCLN